MIVYFSSLTYGIILMYYEDYFTLKITQMFLPIGLAFMKVIFNGKALDVKYEHAYNNRRK